MTLQIPGFPGLRESLAIPQWWRQCESNASKVGLIPLLVFRRNREEPLAVLRWSDLIRLIREIRERYGFVDDHRWQNLAEEIRPMPSSMLRAYDALAEEVTGAAD
jgi:hypothetical protein